MSRCDSNLKIKRLMLPFNNSRSSSMCSIPRHTKHRTTKYDNEERLSIKISGGVVFQIKCRSFSFLLMVRHEVAISTVIPNIVRSPCVLPLVPYRDARRRQRRGVKLSEQCNFN